MGIDFQMEKNQTYIKVNAPSSQRDPELFKGLYPTH